MLTGFCSESIVTFCTEPPSVVVVESVMDVSVVIFESVVRSVVKGSIGTNDSVVPVRWIELVLSDSIVEEDDGTSETAKLEETFSRVALVETLGRSTQPSGVVIGIHSRTVMITSKLSIGKKNGK